MPDISKLNLDESLLQSLSEEERLVLLNTLEDLSRGDTRSFDKLKYSEYEEIPVDIITFLDDDNYLGKAWKDTEGKTKLYPYWRKRLKELFPDNLTVNYNNCIFSGCRGIGKSELSVAICCYMMYKVMCLKNPREYFRLKPTETIAFAFMNITQELSEDIGISKFQNTVQLSPWFMSHGSLEGRKNVKWVPPEYINIIIGSQAKDVIGQAVLFAFFDEISFIRNQDIDRQKAIAIDMINTAIGGMKTRFVYQGKSEALLILASSKRSEKSFLEVHMKKKLETEGDNLFLVDEAIWNVKPEGTYCGKTFDVALGNKFLPSQVLTDKDSEDTTSWINKGYKILKVPIEFRPEFLNDIDRALCDFAGISSSELSKYISGEAWNDTKNESLQNPFVKEIIEVGNAPDDTSEYYDFFDLNNVDKNLMNRPLYIHMDMSVSGDKTGIAGVWIKSKDVAKEGRNPSNELRFRLAFAVSVKAPKGRQISFKKNRNFIYWLRSKGFNIKGVSTDSFQSVDTGQELQGKGYTYKVISVDRVDTDKVNKPYQYFRSCIYEKRIETFNDEVLSGEIIDLERNINSGKVDHPAGGAKDQSDAVCGALYHASQNAEQFAFDFGETMEDALKINSQVTSAGQARKQMQVAFEEELQSLFTSDSIKKQMEEDEKKKENLSPEYLSGLYANQGILIW